MKDTILIVGLGNPGIKYAKNRHNAGFIITQAIEILYSNIAVGKNKKDYDSTNISLPTIVVNTFRPMTYMNNSGIPLQSFLSFYKIQINNIIVIHDDIDIPLGVIKMKMGGSSGGHNGLKSIDSTIGNMYWRIRIGIGRGDGRIAIENFVLQNFTQEEERFIVHISDIISKNVSNMLSIISNEKSRFEFLKLICDKG